MNTGSRQAEQVFAAAMEISNLAERESCVRTLCKDDEHLHQEVAALLNAHEKLGSLVKTRQMTESDLKAARERQGKDLGE